MNRKKLKRQISDSAGNALYTYIAHWKIVNKLKKRYTGIKIVQIILTALATGGFLTTVISGIPWLSWLGGLTSAVSLGLNLYLLNFNASEEIKKHSDAANDLWDVREAYRSLLVDFEELSDDDIRKKRDKLTEDVGRINKSYPGTDEKSFVKAQKEIGKYTFEEGESMNLFFSNQSDDEPM